MLVRDLILEFLHERGSAEQLATADVGSLPLFSNGTLPSLKLVQILLAVQEEVGQLDEPDLTEENFDTIAAIERLIDDYRARRVQDS